MMRPRLLYLNGAFDIALCGQSVERFRGQIDEMSSWFVPVGGASDRVLMDCQLPEEYAAYWQQLGVQLPEFCAPESSCSGFVGDAWGWDQHALGELKSCGADLNHPALDSVKIANSRAFSFELTRQYEPAFGIPGAQFAESFDEVREIINRWQDGPLVVKPTFGNSAIGFARLSSKESFHKRRSRIVELFRSSQPSVTVEPWLERIADFSSHFVLSADGEIGPVQRYSTLVTSGGAFYGMRLGADPIQDSQWLEQLDSMIALTSRSLHDIGYFGPVSVDSMVIKDSNGSPQLVPLVEINARWSMHRIASSVRQRLAPKQQVLFRTLGRKRHQLPSAYEEWNQLLGPLVFNPDTQSGVVCVSSLQIKTDKDWQQPARTLLFIAASNDEQLSSMNDRLSTLLKLNQKSS